MRGGSAPRRAALAVVQSVGYVGAGTVEFIADARGELFFLEVNARLQVEHPVTEMCTGLDLVEQQLRIAAGERLASRSASRRGARATPIEARVYAEDPAKIVRPAAGHARARRVAGGAGDLRVETGVREGDE